MNRPNAGVADPERPTLTRLVGRAASRRELAVVADERLRRYVLVGLAVTMLLDAIVCIALSLFDGHVDPSVALAFAPDLVVSAVTLWLTLRRRATGVATIVMAGYFVLNFTIVYLHVGSSRLLGTAWPLLPPLFGMYVGGRRMGLWMTAATVVGIAFSLAVHASGVGLTTMVFPSFDEPSGTALAGAGSVVIFVLIHVYERSRRQTRGALDEALAELDEKERTLAALIETTSDAILLLDADHRILVTNSAVRALVQQGVAEPRGELVGEAFLSVVAPAQRATWQERLAACREAGQLSVEDVVPVRSGDLHFETSMQCVEREEGVVGFTLIARDITERRRAQAAMHALRRQLLDASRRAGRAEVASNVLHEVGNLLNSVTVSLHQINQVAGALRVGTFRKTAELLGASLESKRPQGDRAGTAVRLLHELVSGLERDQDALVAESRELASGLDAIAAIVQAQEQYAHAANVYEEVDLDEVVRAAIAHDDEHARQVVLSVVAPDARQVVSDRFKIMQVVSDLVRNARHCDAANNSTPGRIEIDVRRMEDGGVAVSVRDEGRGLSEAELATIFRQGGTRASSPAGPNLHTASLVASQLGARLSGRSAGLGQGATFSLELPLEPRDVAAPAVGVVAA